MNYTIPSVFNRCRHVVDPKREENMKKYLLIAAWVSLLAFAGWAELSSAKSTVVHKDGISKRLFLDQ